MSNSKHTDANSNTSSSKKNEIPQDLRQFSALLKIVETLRGPNGCPWDIEQTHRSLTPFAIEEAHELAEAIESGPANQTEIIGELGDLLLQVVLHSEIARQAGTFTFADVVESINQKMVRRHPHVFGDASASNSTEVLDNWAKIKATEKAAESDDAAPRTSTETPRFDVPLNLPALTRASKIGAKTKAFRFDWDSAQLVLFKVEEELNELKVAMREESRGHQEAELGDLLFSLAQLARHLKIEPEQALRTTNQRFEKRFFYMKGLALADGSSLEHLAPEQLERYWDRAKIALADSEKPA